MFLLRIQVMSHQIPLPHLPDLQLLILYFPLRFLEIILTIRIIMMQHFCAEFIDAVLHVIPPSVHPSDSLPPIPPALPLSR